MDSATQRTHGTGPGGEEALPSVGECVVDVRLGDIAEVRGHIGPYLRLRPLLGGPTWDCLPCFTRPATPFERLHAAVAAANTASRRESG